MIVTFVLNGSEVSWETPPGKHLLSLLREHGYKGIKFGDESGMTGADTVLVNGLPMNSRILLAPQIEGKQVVTIEALGGEQLRGWKGSDPLHPLQKAFVEMGAIQCGYCTPAMILAAKALLDLNPDPTEDEVRDAMSGVLCRCTGYVKPVQSVLRAAAIMRGEGVPPVEDILGDSMVTLESSKKRHSVGKPSEKVDALKLVQGNPAFTDDIDLRGLLTAKILKSPHAHALIKRIDTSAAKSLPGVHAVLTFEDLPRVAYTTAGQSDPEPGPHDNYSLDNRVRFVGDRVAAVAAESEEIALKALSLIEVEYDLLPVLLDARESMKPGAPLIHDEADSFRIEDPAKNLAAVIDWELGDVEKAFTSADRVFEATYYSPKVQQTPIEPHVTMTYWDEDDRLVIRTSTQVPFHVRRILAPVLGLPEKQIRVIKPRIGGGFGVKQEVLIEDICAHLTIATGRPVRLELTREEEFMASRTRHDMYLTLKTGVMVDGTIVANSLIAISDTGACGAHALTVAGNTGHKALALYNAPNIKYHADIVYTNKVPSGAYRGYGVPQGFWALEQQMAWIAKEMSFDPLKFRLKNSIKPGDEHPVSKIWSEGREGAAEYIHTCELEKCAELGAEAVQWYERYNNPDWRSVDGKTHLKRGIGVAMVMQGTAIPNLDMGAASIKMNDDGSFNLLVGATDLGTGSDTILAQMAGEVLGCGADNFITYSSDTDFTPFDKGAYASSTTYISGAATVRASEQVAEQIKQVAVRMLKKKGISADLASLRLKDKRIIAPDGQYVTLKEVALNSLHHENQHQIMGTGSYVSPESPPPFAVQFATVTVDVETGQVTVDELVMAVDSGVIINPATATGQIEGGMIQAAGYGLFEELAYDESGHILNPSFGPYWIYRADDVPKMKVIFVESDEPSGPFGAKAVAEIPLDGAGPAIANAVYDAVGVMIKDGPLLPHKVWEAMQEKG